MKSTFFALLLVGAAAVLPAAEKAAMAGVPGLKIGERAAEFALKSSVGGDVSLQGLLKKGPVALVFYRSADWCPFCKKQLQDLQKNLADFEAAGVQIVGISYDAAATGTVAAAKLGLTFPLLADEGSKVIDAYGIRNLEAKGKAEGVPHPVIFIVDQAGVIRAKLARDGYRDRPESAEIIAAVKTLN